LRARLAALSTSNVEILAAYPVAREGAAIRARAAGPLARQAPHRRWHWGLSGLALAVPATAALVFLVVAHPEDRVASLTTVSPDAPLVVSDSRVKGDAHLVLRRKVGEQAEVLDGEARAQRGDLLQVAYVAGGRRYGAIVSWDGRGSVTLHFPTEPYVDTLLSQEGEVLLPTAYELDDAPRFERFVLITADAPIDLDLVMRRAHALAQNSAQAATGVLALPDHYAQRSFLLSKAERE